MNRLFCFSYFLTTNKTNELNFLHFIRKLLSIVVKYYYRMTVWDVSQQGDLEITHFLKLKIKNGENK